MAIDNIVRTSRRVASFEQYATTADGSNGTSPGEICLLPLCAEAVGKDDLKINLQPNDRYENCH